MAAETKHEREVRARDIFTAIDRNGTGTITQDALLAAILPSGLPFERLEMIMQELLARPDSKIQRNDFIAASSKYFEEYETIYRMLQRYDRADADLLAYTLVFQWHGLEVTTKDIAPPLPHHVLGSLCARTREEGVVLAGKVVPLVGPIHKTGSWLERIELSEESKFEWQDARRFRDVHIDSTVEWDGLSDKSVDEVGKLFNKADDTLKKHLEGLAKTKEIWRLHELASKNAVARARAGDRYALELTVGDVEYSVTPAMLESAPSPKGLTKSAIDFLKERFGSSDKAVAEYLTELPRSEIRLLHEAAASTDVSIIRTIPGLPHVYSMPAKLFRPVGTKFKKEGLTEKALDKLASYVGKRDKEALEETAQLLQTMPTSQLGILASKAKKDGLAEVSLPSGLSVLLTAKPLQRQRDDLASAIGRYVAKLDEMIRIEANFTLQQQSIHQLRQLQEKARNPEEGKEGRATMELRSGLIVEMPLAALHQMEVAIAVGIKAQKDGAAALMRQHEAAVENAMDAIDKESWADITSIMQALSAKALDSLREKAKERKPIVHLPRGTAMKMPREVFNRGEGEEVSCLRLTPAPGLC